jgi:hypothetical protein
VEGRQGIGWLKREARRERCRREGGRESIFWLNAEESVRWVSEGGRWSTGKSNFGFSSRWVRECGRWSAGCAIDPQIFNLVRAGG